MTHSTALDLTDVDWGLRGKESREEEERMMKRILAKLRQLNLQYETPGVSSLELNRNPTLEWAASVMEMLKRVTTTWSVNDIYPLIDYITHQLPFIQIDDEKWLDFVCASMGFASLLSVAVTPASDKMAR
ncbi:hypothetical protein WA556_001903, partial [Blastocystis sp. ATCC 50177/Nand II]